MYNKLNARYLIQLRKLFKEPAKPLGRWSIEKTPESISAVNYYSNIDHCGDCNYPCAQISRQRTNRNYLAFN